MIGKFIILLFIHTPFTQVGCNSFIMMVAIKMIYFIVVLRTRELLSFEFIIG